MFDETNKTEEPAFETEENLFEESEADEEDFSDIIDNQNDEEEKTQETLRIKYNGEERDISLDEARVLAQKGLNYDHVVAERDTKYLRELDFLDKVAATKGMTRAQYISSVENSLPMDMNESRGQIENAASRAAMQVRRLQDGIAGRWGELFRRYPELPRESAYASLSEGVRAGMTPLEAYQSKLLEEKEKELRFAHQNGAAAKRSVGSLEGDGSGEELDDFLEGFYSVTKR